MRHTRQLIDEWCIEYNRQRLHGSIGQLALNQFADTFFTLDFMAVSDQSGKQVTGLSNACSVRRKSPKNHVGIADRIRASLAVQDKDFY